MQPADVRSGDPDPGDWERIIAGDFLIGAVGTDYEVFSGSIDELQISQSDRYQSSFVPSDPLVADPSTIVLYHFDEGTGDVLKDSSGHNHHGKIGGAKWVAAGRDETARRGPGWRPDR